MRMPDLVPQASRVIDTHGCRLTYNIHGSADGAPVLFIQGVGVHGNGWRPQVDALAADFHCATFDNRGMGLSQPVGACALTVEQMAEDALAVMRDVGWESAHVVGHSLGGLIALQLALAHREVVRSLSLLCTFADGRIPTRLTPRMLWVGTRTRIGSRRSRRRAFLELVMPPGVASNGDADALAAELEPLFGHDLADQPPIVMPQLRATKRCNLTPRLSELAGVPTLVVSATHDPIAPPPAGEQIAAGISGARHVEFLDASHGLPISHSARVNALLVSHLHGSQAATSQASEALLHSGRDGDAA
jgi:pimeloyl-ACP methyl ester carboxylesterase